MSLNDPLDPESTEPGPSVPMPEPPPPPSAGAQRTTPATPGAWPGPPPPRSLRGQFASISPIIWVGLGIIGTLLVVIAIIATTTLLRTVSAGPTPTPTPTRVVPGLALTPSTAVPGQTVTVYGFNLIPNDPVTIFLRDPARPSDPILQVNVAAVSANGLLTAEFMYPREARWATLLRADVIVQSAGTGAYWTASLTVLPASSLVTPVPVATSTQPPVVLTQSPYTPPPFVTWTPLPTLAPPTNTPTPVVPPTITPPPVITEWRGEYFDNPTLSGTPVVVRNDSDVKFNWGRSSPDPRIPVDNFSARWTRTLGFEGRLYRFSLQADDGVRLWVDDNLLIDEWHAATPQVYTSDVSLSAGLHNVRIEYYEGVLDAYIFLKIEPVENFAGWKGEYFDNPFVSGPPKVIRDDAAIAFDWGTNPPATGLPAQRWSARWTRTVNLVDGTYRFTLRADDGVRLLIDDTLIIDEWHIASGQVYVRDVNLSGGTHKLVVEYYQETGSGSVWLTYQPPPLDITKWRSEFYANDHWAGLPTMIRNDDRIDFDWGFNAPDQLIPADRFSARFTRIFDLPAGEYQFDILVDDGVRFYVDGLLLIDAIKEQAATPYSVRTTLPQGNHEMRIDYVEYTGRARLAWSRTPLSVTVTPAPATPAPTQPPALTPTPESTLPVINQFAIAPNPVVAGQCVSLTWQIGGGAVFARWLRGGALGQDNIPLAGAANDCPDTPGDIIYRLEAFNSVNQSVTRDITVTVQPTQTATLPSVPQPAAITSFTADKTSVPQNQCVTFSWTTVGATTPIELRLAGQALATNLPASGAAQQCPSEVGTKLYELVITGDTPITQSVTIEVTTS